MTLAEQLLTSIDATLKELLVLSKARKTSVPGAAVASDRELDDPKWGDPIVKFDPRDWTSGSCKGSHFSECPPGYLDLLAQSFDYFAEKNDREGHKTDKDVPKSKYDRLAAAKARGWAARIRSGWKPPQMAEAPMADEVQW